MEQHPRVAAQRRTERITLCRQELAQLAEEGGLLLTPEQRTGLEAHWQTVLEGFRGRFGIDATESARRFSWAMRLASVLGGAALLAAVVLFLHRVWGGLPGWAQVLILAAGPLPLLGGAEYAFRRGADLYYPALLSLMAGVVFCMEMSALGSIMNLSPSPHALLAWGSFALLTAYAYGLRLLLAAGLLLLAGYTAALGMSIAGNFWPSLLEEPQYWLPSAAALYAWPWLVRHRHWPHFEPVYRLCGAFAGLVALLILSQKAQVWGIRLGADAVAAVCQLAGIALGAGVVAHGLRLGSSPQVNLGAAGFVVFVYARLHAWLWDWMPKYLFFLLISLTALVLLLVFRRLRAGLSQGAPL